jgi:GWxTD domain-containing protein
MRTQRFIWLCLILMIASSSCRMYQLKRKLDAEDAEFLSTVRYIISKEERKIYLEIPKEDRVEFKKKFWDERDPDPSTEENEYKNQYFDRIEEANRLFTSGQDGWLTDRGRTLVLLGEPVHKAFYPMGDVTAGLSRPTEIWYYDSFPVIFMDIEGTGNYQFYFMGLGHQADVYEAMVDAKKIHSGGEAGFDFTIALKKIDGQNFLVLEIEKQKLWMKEEKEGMSTILEIGLEIYDMSREKRWEHKKDYPVSVSEEEINQGTSGDEVIEVDVDLSPGTYTLISKIKNLTDEKHRNKTRIIKIE